MSDSWKQNRVRLFGLLIFLAVALAGLLIFESKQSILLPGLDGSDAPGEAAGFAPPADDAEAEALMMKEVEAGRMNREPGTFAFVFRETSSRSEDCTWMCLDTRSRGIGRSLGRGQWQFLQHQNFGAGPVPRGGLRVSRYAS